MSTAAEAGPKQYRHALVLGKFMPLHAGHEFLIAEAAARADHVTVLVCTLLREPIPGGLRYQWAAATLARLPNVRVVHVSDEVPAQPEDSPDFWAIWVPLIHRYCHQPGVPVLDVVLTSEAYGAELGRRLQIPAICLDPARTSVPISATQIREAPLASWAFIPSAARPYFVTKVALLGAESSGKTTLAAALATHFQTVWVPEFVRDYLEDGPNIAYTAADLHAIGAGQRALERAYAPLSNGLLFCDTDALTTATWAELYFGEDHVPAGLTRFAHTDRYALTLLLAPDLPWVPDGTRDRPDQAQRLHHFHRLRHWLEQVNRPYTLISGESTERFTTARQAVETLIRR